MRIACLTARPTVVLLTLACSCVIPISTTAPQGDAGGDGYSPVDDGAAPLDAEASVYGTPPTGTWTNVTANLANIPSECGTLTGLSVKPNEDMLIASVYNVSLYANTGGDGTWQMLGTGTGSVPITSYLTDIVYDPDDSTRFWQCGIHGSGVSETNDDGQTFAGLGAISDNDLISVDFSDPDRLTILAGGHEQAQTLYRTMDGGQTWTNIGGGLPAGSYCTLPLLIDTQTYLVGCTAAGGGPSGIYRTTDGAATWTVVSASGGGVAPLTASDGSIYWVSPLGAGMTRSTDQGQTWTDVVGSGVFDSTQGSLTGGPPLELPDGRLAVMGQEYVLVSSDHGVTWSPVTALLPTDSTEDLHGVVYSSQRKAFYVWHNECSFDGPIPVSADAVLRFDFDYTTQ